MRSKMTEEKFQLVFRSILLVVGGAAAAVLVVATFLQSKLRTTPHESAHILCSVRDTFGISEIAPWTGRFYSLLDPSYAKNNIPIIASVSEHQPTAWSSFYFDLQFLVFAFPGMQDGVLTLTANHSFSWSLLLLQAS